jgi:hypothetical protein
MWRNIFEWIGPRPPTDTEEVEGLVLGVLAMALLVVSLPFLFGFLSA